MGRFVLGVIIGAFAAAGGYSLGFSKLVVGIIFAIPFVFGIIGVLAVPVFLIFILFGAAEFAWAYTSLPTYLGPYIKQYGQSLAEWLRLKTAR